MAPVRSGDDKSVAVLSFLQPLLTAHQSVSQKPFFLGLNGIQGAGKTTLVRQLATALSRPPYSVQVAVLSIDDLYLPHAEQKTLAQGHPGNPLVQHRGQPGTHDVALGARLFDALREGKPARLPQYDKSAFRGEGDRVPEQEWETLNEGVSKVQLVIFEGWCVGFRALDDAQLRLKWESARRKSEEDLHYSGRLGLNSYENVELINENLKAYSKLTECVCICPRSKCPS